MTAPPREHRHSFDEDLLCACGEAHPMRAGLVCGDPAPARATVVAREVAPKAAQRQRRPRSPNRAATAPRRRNRGNSKLSDDQVERLRHEAHSGASQGELAERYGLSEPAVSLIVRGLSYAHVGGPLLPKGRAHSVHALEERVIRHREFVAYVVERLAPGDSDWQPLHVSLYRRPASKFRSRCEKQGTGSFRVRLYVPRTEAGVDEC